LKAMEDRLAALVKTNGQLKTSLLSAHSEKEAALKQKEEKLQASVQMDEQIKTSSENISSQREAALERKLKIFTRHEETFKELITKTQELNISLESGSIQKRLDLRSKGAPTPPGSGPSPTSEQNVSKKRKTDGLNSTPEQTRISPWTKLEKEQHYIFASLNPEKNVDVYLLRSILGGLFQPSEDCFDNWRAYKEAAPVEREE
jgi:hypothetical protein